MHLAKAKSDVTWNKIWTNVTRGISIPWSQLHAGKKLPIFALMTKMIELNRMNVRNNEISTH